MEAPASNEGGVEGEAALKWTIVAANFFGWAAVQLGTAGLFLLLPSRYFESAASTTERHAGEIDFYRHLLSIRKWKKYLPDGASWVGGQFSKRRMASRDPQYMRQFILESRRGEAAHWVMVLAAPVFFLWNPPWACGVITLYALSSNLPCIAVQRHNRFVMSRYLSSR